MNTIIEEFVGIGILEEDVLVTVIVVAVLGFRAFVLARIWHEVAAGLATPLTSVVVPSYFHVPSPVLR